MAAIHDTLFRQWVMLRAIPREPQTVSTPQILERLKSEGYEVSDRTVARDLDSLSAVFGYTCEERGRAKHWFWPSGSRVLDIPGMEATAAMAWMMSRDFLGKSLPPGAIEHLQPYFARAEEVLGSHRGRRQSKWQSVFRVARRGPVLSPPTVSSDIFRGVSEALLEGHQICVQYRSREKQEDKEYTLHPIALVLRHQVYYLVATAWDYKNPIHFALHRMESVVVQRERSRTPAKFNLDDYVETSFQYPASPQSLSLRLRVNAAVASHLAERPLGKDQKTQPLEDGWVRVRVTAQDSSELRWWIMGFGAQIVVEGPAALRREFAETARELAAHYAI